MIVNLSKNAAAIFNCKYDYQIHGETTAVFRIMDVCVPFDRWNFMRIVSFFFTCVQTLITLKGVCLLLLLCENIFPVLISNWFYVLLKQKWIWNLSLCYFSLFCFYLTGYDGRTAERKSDSTWRTWYKQTLRVYHSRRPISWLIPDMQYPVIYIIKFSNN